VPEGRTGDEPIGTCCLVLHTHLPWLLHHGAWPVGEEWLHQAWATSYLPLVSMLDRLAAEGGRDLLTLGLTPVLAAQLDDPYALREFHTWLGFWRTRADGLAHRRGPVGDLGRLEVATAEQALTAFEDGWRSGASPALRPLVDNGVVELLGGPATHPFQPLLDERVARFALRTGLDDAQLRLGRRPRGIWAPECGYRPGLERLYAEQGVRHLVMDGPTLLAGGASPADAWTLGDSDVVAFGRDLEVTYRVWSPRRGYPGGPWYRDFHAYDHDSGFRLSRVTSPRTPSEDKAPYDPGRAQAAIDHDVDDFVATVRRRLEDHRRERDGRPGLVVVAYDTELFGHWWHEGPQFLECVLRALPAAGVRLTTLSGAIEAGHVAGRADPGPGSWGSGKDWRVWDGAAVADVVETNAAVQRRLLTILDAQAPSGATGRRPVLDQLARAALLTLASDWAFMVSHDSAVEYARSRLADHLATFEALAAEITAGSPEGAVRLAARQRATDGPFGHLDARLLQRSG
jgi:1,4-alpha-glucan branching enzyme